MRSNKGMGMIKLILMLVFIAVVVVAVVYFVIMKYHEVRVETIKTDMLQVQWKIKDYIDKQTVKGEEKKYLGTKISEMKEDIVLKEIFENNVVPEEEYEKYYALKDEDLAVAGLEITNYEDSYFLINYETYEVIVTKGCEYSKEETLYKLTDIINKSNEEAVNQEENKQENQENQNEQED